MKAVPPTAIRERTDPSGAWWLREREPHPSLAPFVSIYEDYGSSTKLTHRDRHFPFGGVPLIWTFEGALDQIDVATGDLHRSNNFIAGLHDRYATTESSGSTRGVQVNLTPIGARMLLGMSMHELTNTFIRLEDAPGASWGEVGQRLYSTRDTAARFAILDDFFIGRFARTRPVPEGIAWAWNQIESSSGNVRISDLAAATGQTRKHIVSDFREYVGLPPKTLARISRFNRALKLIERHRGTPQWTRVAAECGYYDQAHFIREVRAFSGDTPTELLRRLIARPASTKF